YGSSTTCCGATRSVRIILFHFPPAWRASRTARRCGVCRCSETSRHSPLLPVLTGQILNGHYEHTLYCTLRLHGDKKQKLMGTCQRGSRSICLLAMVWLRCIGRSRDRSYESWRFYSSGDRRSTCDPARERQHL